MFKEVSYSHDVALHVRNTQNSSVSDGQIFLSSDIQADTINDYRSQGYVVTASYPSEIDSAFTMYVMSKSYSLFVPVV